MNDFGAGDGFPPQRTAPKAVVEEPRWRLTRRTTLHGERRRLHWERGWHPLSEVVGPQRSDRTVRHSAGDGLPTLALSGGVGR